jgi:predicted DCC family thiol-disulfide oxidoreductase YuxK
LLDLQEDGAVFLRENYKHKSWTAHVSTGGPIVFYDGFCGLCDRFTQFVLRRDRKDVFRFASLQSDFAKQILARHGLNPERLDTVYVVVNFSQPNERVLSRSNAVLFVARQIGGLWRVAATSFGILPQSLRDAVYEFVARNRYRWFGRYESCLLPDPTQSQKFLDRR